ncbi:MBL fold metallo-hydrolase [Streptomyces sp. HB2AG]|uniref:MBL fold metallo-hydrolase n=1 Tax=Streptomyces sp. HB2AG TaxID=2983400 RepID=UPI0022AAEC32|nr:MBL fold metallo-hydrolase [Streptomyces sp. HB2AG]MCZ2525128.1 MBL fold metallo-hydrolase [Streptomyces sp. HB2AG]
METIEITPNLRMLRFEVGQAYLWRDGDELTLVDTGPAGSGPGIAAAIREPGMGRHRLRRVVLTHFHEDHAGSAAEIGAWGDVEVMAHRLEAPVVRGEVPGPPPVLEDWERPIRDALPPLPPAPPARVDRELEDGDLIGFGGGAVVVATPGHTDGSLAVHLPAHGVLFTGDTVAHMEGQVMLGVFNLDRACAASSFRRLAGLDVRTACFGHGDPIVEGAAERMHAVVRDLPA